MYAWEAIQQSIEYIENHDDQALSVEDLAKIANLSPYYYQRLFYRLVHKRVGEYLKLRRLAKAADQLKNSQDTILKIALDHGFLDHSHFTNAFKATYKVTPNEYRKSSLQLDHFLKPDLVLNYTMIDENVPLIVEDMVLTIRKDKVARDIELIGKRKKASIKELGEPKINSLVELWESIDGKNPESVGIDVLTLTPDPEYFDYFVGFEADDQLVGEKQTIPKGEYIVCSYEAEDFEQLVNVYLYKASQYLYDTWLKEKGIETDPILIQKYFHPYTKNCFIELWAKVKEDHDVSLG